MTCRSEDKALDVGALAATFEAAPPARPVGPSTADARVDLIAPASPPSHVSEFATWSLRCA
jgi:hypothetical protein